MKRDFLLFFSAIITLFVFAFTSCFNPFFNNLPKEPAFYQIEIGKGTPYFVYLDSDYNPIETTIGINDPDPGKTAVLVNDNPLAEGVMALAETTSNGTTVSIINKNNDSKIYMFFKQGENFPSSFIIETQDNRVNAFLSNYNTQREQYSITFEHDGEFFTQDNIIMNKSILSIYEDDSALTVTQNTRIRNFYTALGVYGSLYNVFSNENDTVFLNALGDFLGDLWNGFKTVVKTVFVAVAVVAFVVAFVYATPFVIGGISFLIPGLGNLTAFTALGISIAAGIGTKLVDMLPDASTGPVFEGIIATIKNNGEEIKKGMVFYIEPEGYIDFVINFTFPQSGSKVSYGLYEPSTDRWYPSTLNDHFFDIKAISNNTSAMNLDFNSPVALPSSFTLRISRNGFEGTGTNGGYLDFVLAANKALVVNDNYHFFDIYDDDSDTIVNTCSVYVIRLTIRQENEKTKDDVP